jgi:O-antigen/teichoic acid export membrane protein
VSILAWLKFLFGVALDVLLIPRFGEKGAAAAMAITHIIGAVVYVSLYLRVSGSRLSDLFYIRSGDVCY